MTKINVKNLSMVSAGLLVVFFYISCKKIAIVESTTTDKNIYGYLKANPDKYSKIVTVIDKSGYAGFLDAYGSYTMFVPNDSAVSLYLVEISKPSVDALTETEAKNIVKFHLLEDTLTTAVFKDGKLPLVTMYGQYLVTSITNAGGKSSFNVNRQALVINGNTKTGNGFVHEIDHVLKPAVKSIAELITENPNLSIFKQALVATGFYDTLNTINLTNPARRWFTALAETNQALADSGITSYNALKAKYSNTGNPANPLDSLYIYMAYHIMPEAKYLADIVSANSHFSLAPLEVLASSLDGEKILINDLSFNGVHEPGVELNRGASDVSATTGVLHLANAHFSPKLRFPTAVYWDVADFPEVRRLPAIFRKANGDFEYNAIADIKWNFTTNRLSGGNATGFGYRYDGIISTSFPTYFGDCLNLGLGTTSRHNWVEFTTPLIIKGRYNIWICYKATKQSGNVFLPGGSNLPVQWEFDGVPTSRQMNFNAPRPANTVTDGEMLALGWKRYTVSTLQEMSGKFIGAVNVTTTSRHKMRLVVLPAAGTGQNINILDMIHFIPVDAPSQFLPRFAQDGSLVYN
jgi:uncharacterized surface protein with fasciclin (FAS1) repeats